MLRIAEKMSREEIAAALEAARLMGLFETEITYPVAGTAGDTEPAAVIERYLGDLPDELPEQEVHPDVLFDVDFRKERGLEGLFLPGDFLKDADHDGFPDALDVKFILPPEADAYTVGAACDLACRLGAETTGFCGGLLAEADHRGNAVVFVPADAVKMTRSVSDGAVRVTVAGSGEALTDFASLLCTDFPHINAHDRLDDVLQTLCEDFALMHGDGQLAALAALGAEAEGAQAYVSYGLTEEQKAVFPKTVFEEYKSGAVVYSKSYDLPWEVDAFRDVLEQKLYAGIRAGDTVDLFAALSEPQALREELAQEIRQRLAGLGAVVGTVRILDAYKQGLSWIREAVLPALQKTGADSVEIFFKPFLPAGDTVWRDENGATPNKIRRLEDTPGKWFDLPIRYLQELYPVEDMIVSAINVGRDAVRFAAYEGEEDVTYLLRAKKGSTVCYEETYRSACAERPFMDEYPQLGLVHPSTGYVRACVNGAQTVDERIRTDLESVWDVYQHDVLPDCRAYVEREFDGRLRRGLQPFFKELHLDITLSETEYRTGSREDMVSPLNALHEDLYFTGTDYFKYLGQQKGDGPFDAPGLILPDLHIGKGRPAFTVTLTRQLREQASIEKDGRVLCVQRDRAGVSAFVSAVGLQTGVPAVTVQTKGVSEELLTAYAALLEAGTLKMAGRFAKPCLLELVPELGRPVRAFCKPGKQPEKTVNIADVDLMEHKVIGYEDCRDILEQLQQVEGLSVFPVAESYEGRTIYAVRFTDGSAADAKRLNTLPTLYINARHHANEVSSTNAAFMLIRTLLQDKKYRDVAKKLNLVIVPMENTDGTAIHTRLSAEHPNWKLHTARFNAVGKEFAGEYFSQTTLSTEALALTRIYSRYLPDILVDNHGVPSHEWEQQFSGYTSPAYKGFWLPRSLLYGYFWYAKDAAYVEKTMPVNKKMEDVIADAIGADAEMARWNREWSAQFEKYAHAWMPALFPADYYKEMINYWIPFDWNPQHMYAAVRLPWITAVSYTSEVADETAQGAYLNLCARAHLTHDLATIDMLLAQEQPAVRALARNADGSFAAVCRRLRPLKA